jgi:uncharacterized damage-inducible protein DinB
MAGFIRTAVAVEPTRRPPVMALRERLDELMRLVMTLSTEVYRTRTAHASGAIGEHVRHVLDHVSALIGVSPTAVLSYDHRTRGTSVESDPSAAVREMMRLDLALERWTDRSLDEPIAVATVLDGDGQSVTGWSTRARELAFVMNHTIHHQAIIALLLEFQGREPLDDRFGYAPSTPSRA